MTMASFGTKFRYLWFLPFFCRNSLLVLMVDLRQWGYMCVIFFLVRLVIWFPLLPVLHRVCLSDNSLWVCYYLTDLVFLAHIFESTNSIHVLYLITCFGSWKVIHFGKCPTCSYEILGLHFLMEYSLRDQYITSLSTIKFKVCDVGLGTK